MQTVVFINSHSRQAAQSIKSVKRFFSKSRSPFKILDYIIVEELNDFDNCMRRLAKYKNVECVIIGSGDGTIVAALNALKKRKKIVYGFIPLGTSNTFVRSLGLPINLRKALNSLSKNNIRDVSLGSVNGVLFANIADIGVPVHVADNLTNRVKKYLGSLAYAVSGIRELVRHDAIWCEIKTNGETRSFYTHQVFIANGKNRGPATINEGTSAFSDKLTLGYSKSKSRLEYLRDAFGFLIGSTEKRENLHFEAIEKAVIKTRPVQMIQADGEIIGKTPAKIKVVKKAIRVLTPPEEPGRQRRLRRNPR